MGFDFLIVMEKFIFIFTSKPVSVTVSLYSVKGTNTAKQTFRLLDSVQTEMSLLVPQTPALSPVQVWSWVVLGRPGTLTLKNIMQGTQHNPGR